MLQGVPTLYPNGVSNAAPGSFGAGVPMPWPPQYYTWFSDFDRFFGLADSNQADWLTTAVGSSTIGVIDAFGGQIQVTTGATENDGITAQWQGMNPDAATPAQVAETFLFEAKKELWFAVRFKVNDVTQTDLVIGLVAATTTPMDPVDGVYFSSVDGSAALLLAAETAAPLSASDTLFTMADDTWYEVGFHYNGIDAINAYRGNTDGTWSLVGSLGVTVLPTTELAMTFGLLTGEDVANNALIDWILCSRER